MMQLVNKVFYHPQQQQTEAALVAAVTAVAAAVVTAVAEVAVPEVAAVVEVAEVAIVVTDGSISYNGLILPLEIEKY